jgi:hypothetical protein
MRADGLKATVMVGKHKSIGRYDNTRAIASEVYHAILDGIFALVQSTIRELVVFLLHGLINGIWQVIQCPHALICFGSRE